MTRADLPRIHRWLQTPPVREGWIDADGTPSDPIGADDLATPDVAMWRDVVMWPDVVMWIVSCDERPFAFLQDDDPQATEGHHFAHLPSGSRGIDPFVGEPGMIGRGHGSAFVRARVETLLAGGVPAVGTDPHPDDARAIRACEKAGFRATAIRATHGGRCLLMERHAEDAT